MDAVEASPDGTKLYVVGQLQHRQRRHHARASRVSTRPRARRSTEFTANANGKVNELAVTNTTVYAGGRFTTVNNIPRGGLAAVDGTTGAVRTDFVNNITGGIGTNGVLAVQRLKLTHDEGRLLVVHTGRQVNGQDRYGVALINTRTNKLLPWRTRLWEDNLQFVGGIQRIYGGDIAPDDSWFVVASGSGGDRPPINDTVDRLPTGRRRQRRSRSGSRGTSTASTRWPSPSRPSTSAATSSGTSRRPRRSRGRASTTSATAPARASPAYALGDAVVRRDHIGALNPADGTAAGVEPGSNSFEGNKHIEATPRGLFTGGDGNTKGELQRRPRSRSTTSTRAAPATGSRPRSPSPIEGRVEPVERAVHRSPAPRRRRRACSGSQVEVMDRSTRPLPRTTT